MQAISEIIELSGPTLHYTLPAGFEARRVQLIILPVDELPGDTTTRPNRIRSLRGSIKGKAADSLEEHLKTIRNEWWPRYLIDSSAASNYLEERFSENGLAFMDAIFDTESNISVIAKIELLTWNPAQAELEEKVSIFVEDSTVYDLSEAIVDQTVQIRRKYRLKTPDAIIAATALVHGFVVVTDNERDFDNIKGLKWANPSRM